MTELHVAQAILELLQSLALKFFSQFKKGFDFFNDLIY